MFDLSDMKHTFAFLNPFIPFRTLAMLAFLFLTFGLGACQKDTPPTDPDVTVVGSNADTLELQSSPLRYLALGDSYTIGESVPEAERWPNQLVDSLRARNAGTVWNDAAIVATTGWTTTNLSNGMDAAQVDTVPWDLVSLLIGVNNQYQGLPVDDYANEFGALLDRAVSLTGGRAERVFVVSIPDYGYTPFGASNQSSISAALQTFNDTCFARAQAEGIAHFNITPISQQHPEIPGLVAPDGLHPSGLQYSLWVESFVEGVQDLVE